MNDTLHPAKRVLFRGILLMLRLYGKHETAIYRLRVRLLADSMRRLGALTYSPRSPLAESTRTSLFA